MKQIEANIRGKGELVPEFMDYLLIKHLYHCTPSELDNQDENILRLHYRIMNMEWKEERLEAKRQEQKAKVK